MRYCENCGAELLAQAQYCGNCGRLLSAMAKDATGITKISTPNLPLSDTPPFFNSFSSPPLESAPSNPQNTDATVRQQWSVEDASTQQARLTNEGQRDDDRAILPEAIPPLATGGLVAAEGLGQLPTGNAPMVHGTPQIGNVPMVHGTPQIGNMPGVHGTSHITGHATPPPHPAAPSIPQHTWPWEQHQSPTKYVERPSDIHHPHAPASHHQQPTTPQHPTRTPKERHEHQRHKQVKKQHAHKSRFGRAHHTGAATTSKLALGGVTKWIIMLLAAIVILAFGGIFVVRAIPPALALSGSSNVTAGGILLLHGKGFLPGGSVTFNLDNGLPVSLINRSPARAGTYDPDRGASSASTLQILLAEQSVIQAASNATVSVGTLGTFDATIRVNTNWSPGLHKIRATESFGSRTAALSFTIIAAPKLLVQQKKFTSGSSDCLVITGSGNLIRGWLCTVKLNTDSGDLSWSASSTDPSDRFTPSAGIVHPNHSELVTIFIPNMPRCSNATFTFVGPTNTIDVSWRCPTQ